MKQYCLDMSGLSNPYGDLPHDIYVTLWREVMSRIEAGIFATTSEIYDHELLHIPGELGECIKANKPQLVLEVNAGTWDWRGYIAHSTRMNTAHHQFIWEYVDGNPKKTVGLNDMSIIALGKTLSLPVLSMETSAAKSPKHRRIPDICDAETMQHYWFNDFLRAENIRI